MEEIIKLNPVTLEEDPNGVDYIRFTTPSGSVVTHIYQPPVPPTLDDVKQQKLGELHGKMVEATMFFTSSALGTEHTYQSDPNSMMLLTAAYTRLNAPDAPLDYSVLWYTVEEGRVTHNADQIRQIFKDGMEQVQADYDRYATLESQVLAAQTEDEVNSVTW